MCDFCGKELSSSQLAVLKCRRHKACMPCVATISDYILTNNEDKNSCMICHDTMVQRIGTVTPTEDDINSNQHPADFDDDQDDLEALLLSRSSESLHSPDEKDSAHRDCTASLYLSESKLDSNNHPSQIAMPVEYGNANVHATTEQYCGITECNGVVESTVSESRSTPVLAGRLRLIDEAGNRVDFSDPITSDDVQASEFSSESTQKKVTSDKTKNDADHYVISTSGVCNVESEALNFDHVKPKELCDEQGDNGAINNVTTASGVLITTGSFRLSYPSTAMTACGESDSFTEEQYPSELVSFSAKRLPALSPASHALEEYVFIESPCFSDDDVGVAENFGTDSDSDSDGNFWNTRANVSEC